MAKWRIFAEREFGRVVRDLGAPCATRALATGMNRCPRHQIELGKVSRMCFACHEEVWTEIGRRYATAEQGHTGRVARPAPQTLPGRTHEPSPGQLELFGAYDTKEITMNSTEIVEGELVPDVYEPPEPPTHLFGVNGVHEPAQMMARVTAIADELARLIRSRGLAGPIAGKEYVRVEGWTALGALLGVFPYTVWTRKLEDGSGWEARVEVRTLDGRAIGAAECLCSREESRWRKADEYAIRSMAATRATSKALRAPLGFVMAAAGYDPLPLEEAVEGSGVPKPTTSSTTSSSGPIPGRIAPTSEQAERIRELIAALAVESPDVDWTMRARDIAGVSGDMVTKAIANTVIEKLEAEVDAKATIAAQEVTA
jgi:hypothetical protein